MTEVYVRKMASIQKIAEVKAIPDADKICAYRVNGWWIVDQVGKYVVGDLVVYAEPDSWIPTTLAPFLTKAGGISPRRILVSKVKNFGLSVCAASSLKGCCCHCLC